MSNTTQEYQELVQISEMLKEEYLNDFLACYGNDLHKALESIANITKYHPKPLTECFTN